MQLSKHNLHLKFSAPLSRGVAQFWSWWISELRAMLPPRVRRVLMPRVQRLYLELDGGDLVMSQGTAQNKQELTRHTLDQADAAPVKLSSEDDMYRHARELVLCLPEDKVLTKSLTLPLAAEENLREVLSFEMDRQTPFTAEQVYYDYSIVARSSADRTLTVNLVLATRHMLDELLARLDARDLHPDRVTINCGESGGFAAVNLLPVENRQRKAVTPRLVNLALGVLVVLLLLSAVSLPLLNKRQKIQALEPLLETAKAKAEEAHRLRKEVDQLTANSRFLTDRKQSSLPVLQIIDELTRILPDDTWITRLDIKGSEVQIQGQSSSAAALIPLIESSSILENPRFRSPVTQVPRSNVERFHLSAETLGPTP
jgi:general secretion pathway protein L